MYLKANLIMLLLFIAGFYGCPIAYSLDAEDRKVLSVGDPEYYFDTVSLPTAQKYPLRKLSFRGPESAGAITICNGPVFMYVSPNNVFQAANALGGLAVPADKVVQFKPNHNFFRNPELIGGLNSGSIDLVTLRFILMDDSDDAYAKRAVEKLCGLKSLCAVNLSGCEFSDDLIGRFSRLENLQCLNGSKSACDGSFFKSFVGHPKLRVLIVNSNQLKLANLKYLAEIPHLQVLCLNKDSLTNSSLRYLIACKDLRYLELSDNKEITDAALPELAKLSNLRFIGLSGTSVTREGLEKTLALKVPMVESSFGVTVFGKSSAFKPEHKRRKNRGQDIDVILAPVTR